jgi:hypothetical protein
MKKIGLLQWVPLHQRVGILCTVYLENGCKLPHYCQLCCSILSRLLLAHNLISWFFLSSPSNRNICPAGIGVKKHFTAAFSIPPKNCLEAIQKPLRIS